MWTDLTLLPPPWMALPEIERASIHWRMGTGEAYLDKWNAWYRTLNDVQKQDYLRLFPEPMPWLGTLTQDSECEKLREGDLFLDLWREGGKPRYTREAIVQAYTQGAMPELFLFWGHRPSRDGKITRSCFSQWWQSDFFFHGRKYFCMEQCMMMGKALLFQDASVQEKIMACTSPQKIKALGRAVRPFDDQMWNRVKYPLVLSGNYNKFVQNPVLRRFLLSTGDSILVEASPYDCIWGIGLSADDPRAQDPRQWRGNNLLGFALMEVRDEIRRVYANEALCCDPWAD